jgi:serine protease Do
VRNWKVVLAAVAFPLGIAVGIALTAGDGDENPGSNRALEARSGSLHAAGARSTDSWLAAIAAAAQSQEAQDDLPFSKSSPRYTPIVEAARRVAPSVVSITVFQTVRQPVRTSLFEEFFGRMPRSGRTAQAIGSGFVIDEDGYILTNDHVVSGADSIVVADARGRRFVGRLVGGDALLDIAVLRVEAGTIPPAPLGTSADLVVGEPAIALGNPLGLLVANAEATVTTGVISGVGRDMRGESNDGTLFADMIQTDASINPGNSGGALVNAEGRVIGVNSSILSRSGGSEGLGFAIPIDRALRIAGELKEFGRIRRPWIGVDPEVVSSDTSLFSRTRVRRVAEGSPADRAGLRPGDVLVRVQGRPIDSPLDFEVGLLDAGVGSQVDVVYARDGRERETRLAVIELPSERAERVEVLTGLQLITVDERISVERGLPVDFGALIVDISDEAAYRSRLRAGDVIVAINQRRVATVEDADALFRSFAGGSRILASVVRNGQLVNNLFYIR